ncbi:MAG: hypothetical protein JWN34_1366, partial [Bryobacterales bacterium]|nr:hypothetical protein [Bryobacterales bacterium]
PLIPVVYILVGSATIIYGIFWAPIPSISALATILAGSAVYASTRRAA